MKTLTPASFLLFAFTVCCAAQTAAPAKPATGKAPVHHVVAKKPAACLEAPMVVAPAGIPVVAGTQKALFSVAYALRVIDTKVGTGADAPATGWYKVHYTGYLAKDGKKFDSSVDRGEPIDFPVGQHRVIPGWDQGFAGMKMGGKRRIFIPYQLAYGEAGRPPVIPAKSDLIFDVELISVSDKAPEPKPRPTPVPPAAKPGSAPAGSAVSPGSAASPGSAKAPAASTPAGTATPPAGTTQPVPATPTDKAAPPAATPSTH